jgi:uncharacterized lipoprotein NlpE involved in copper resistance
MYKKVFIVMLLTAVLGLGACLSNRAADVRNSRISLDWAGLYAGTIPSASHPGIDARLTLNMDQSYELNYVYLDRPDGSFTWTGSFQWDEKGSIIKLDVNEAPPYYKVVEDKLIQLDMKGKPIESKFPDNYVLNKVK